MAREVRELVIDCTTGQGCERDYEGDIAALQVIADPRLMRRHEVLLRLRARAATDEVLADLLFVLGLEEDEA